MRNDDIIKEKQEDHNLGKIYRTYLEANYGIKFAPDELCDQFSIEAWKRDDVRYKGSFGFHGWNLDFSTSGLPYIPYLLPNFQKKIFWCGRKNFIFCGCLLQLSMQKYFHFFSPVQMHFPSMVIVISLLNWALILWQLDIQITLFYVISVA